MYELTIKTEFSSAHNLRGYEGACERLHGHNWHVEVSIEAEKTGPMGFVMDFKELKAATAAIIDKLDHRYLNETPPFTEINPSAELIAKFIHDELVKIINDKKGVRVSKVLVWESDTAAASYREDKKENE
ncbi:MAG: 6-carboxytetrahydropterin synthase QueD [Thermodesulfobacteriota bacterium]